MENTKLCLKCNVCKNISEFHTRTRSSGNIYVCKYCKLCEKHRKQGAEYVEKALERKKQYYQENSTVILEKVKKYRNENSDKIKQYQQMYHKLQINVDRRNERRCIRRQNNEEYRLMCNISSRITKMLKSNKSTSTLKLVGCNVGDFRVWLEYQFDSKMSWNNYGDYWHIDHVIPCNYFNLTIEDEQLKCFHWTNCRPLEKTKNIIKSDKYIPFQILLQELKVNYFLQHVQIAGKS